MIHKEYNSVLNILDEKFIILRRHFSKFKIIYRIVMDAVAVDFSWQSCADPPTP